MMMMMIHARNEKKISGCSAWMMEGPRYVGGEIRGRNRPCCGAERWAGSLTAPLRLHALLIVVYEY